MENFKFLSTSTIQRGTIKDEYQEDSLPPKFPCPPTCKSINHHVHSLDISLFYTLTRRPPPPEVPSSPPPPPPPKPPKSPHSNSFCRYIVKKPFVPPALFLCQGIVSLGPSPNANPSRSAMVVIADKREAELRLKDLDSRGMPLHPIHKKAVEVVVDAIKDARALGILISDRPPTVPDEVQNQEKITDVVVHIKEYHKRYSNLIDRVWSSIAKIYPLVPNSTKTELPPVPETRRGRRLPSVALKLFGGTRGHKFDSSPSSCPSMTMITVKKTDEDEEERPSVRKLMTVVMESLREPEKVSFQNDDSGVEITASSYMRAYRRLSRLTKKTAAELELVDGNAVVL